VAFWQGWRAPSCDRSQERLPAERINGSFVSRIIRLALLTPDIVEAILAGMQPAHLTLRDLMGPFPVEWKGQRAVLVNRGDG
jgi:hypothetical protein